ncbi:MAG: tetratricopeptide repeat protein [bacterium]
MARRGVRGGGGRGQRPVLEGPACRGRLGLPRPDPGAPTSADLWYNLGCAEARAGRLGHAIQAFEQALVLRPGDDDAGENLDKVRALALERGVAGAGDARVIPGRG